MLRIAFAGTFAAGIEGRVRAHLEVPCDVVVSDEAGIVPKLSDVDVLVTMVFTAEMASGAGRLRLVQVPGAGLDRIDRAALPSRAWLANVYGHETGIAEYVIGAMLSLTRDFARLDAALRRGVWESQWAVGAPTPPPWPELAGRTLGILGYGRIGQALARRARAFDMNVRAIRRDHTRADPHAIVLGPDALDDVLASADYLAITLPLTPVTRGLLGDAQLRTMKPAAVLVNVARAEIVDEDALYEALENQRIAGAAFDCFAQEPVTLPHRFGELDNVLLAPHSIAWTNEMFRDIGRAACQVMVDLATGKEPRGVLNPEVFVRPGFQKKWKRFG
jgi:phosphoglycerate dehydrogenase-like enzyme